jgi:hypothetical protein
VCGGECDEPLTLPTTLIVTTTCSAALLWGALDIQLPQMVWQVNASQPCGDGYDGSRDDGGGGGGGGEPDAHGGLRCDLRLSSFAWPGGVGWMATKLGLGRLFALLVHTLVASFELVHHLPSSGDGDGDAGGAGLGGVGGGSAAAEEGPPSTHAACGSVLAAKFSAELPRAGLWFQIIKYLWRVVVRSTLLQELFALGKLVNGAVASDIAGPVTVGAGASATPASGVA